MQSSRNTIASFTVFVNYNASEVTPELLSAAFNEKLNQITDGNTRKRVLGTKFVLAMSTDGINFTPSLNNVVGKISFCDKKITVWLLHRPDILIKIRQKVTILITNVHHGIIDRI